MADPTIAEQFFKPAGGAASTPGGGGTVAQQFFGSPTPSSAAAPPATNTFTVPTATSSSSHGGGGFLGTLSRIPGDFVSHVVPDVEGAVIGTGRLIKNAVAPGTHPSWGQLAHEYTHPLDWFSSKAIAADPLASQVVQTAKGTLQVARHPLRDPFATALLGYGLGSGVARFGLAGRAGYLDPLAQAPLGKITARAAEGGAPVTVRVLPRDPFIAARMRAVDKALKKVTKLETPVVGEYARAARSVERSAKVPYLKALADPRLATYQRALGKLSKVDRVALGTLARVPLPSDLEAWKGVLRGQDTEIATRLATVLSDPKLLERYGQFEKFPKIVAAHEAAKALVAANEEIGLRTGALTPETIASAPFIATRVARGAEFVKETPARLGRLDPGHVAHAKYTARLEKLHTKALQQARRNAAVAILGLKGRLTAAQKDAALAHLEGTGAAEGVPGLIGSKIVTAVEGPPKVATVTREVPRTPEEAAARLAEVEAAHNRLVDEMAEAQLGPMSPQAKAGRTRSNNAIRRAQTGKTKTGKQRGTISPLARQSVKPPLEVERRALIEKQLADLIAADPSILERVPQMRAYQERLTELTDLQHALAGHDLPEFAREPGVGPNEAALGTRTETTTTTRPGAPGVGRLITPVGGSRAERLGNALSVARDELERLDRAAAARVRPTGLVGGGTPEEIAAQISRSTGLPPGAYEREVVHVTTPAGAAGIRSGGFKLRAKGGLGGDDYGPAVYLADRASDMAGFWRNQLETKNETGIVETEALGGAVSLARPFEVDYNRYNLRGDSIGRLSPRDVLEAQRPDLVPSFDKARAGGASERRALGDAVRSGGYDGLVVHLPQGDEIVAFDPGRVAFEGAGGRPQPLKLPDRTLQEAEMGRGVGMGSGLTPPDSPVRQSTGALLRTGAIDLTTDRLTPHYLAMARYESKGLKHELVKGVAQAVPKGEGLPPGMVWVRSTRGESIPHLETVKLEHLAELDRIFPESGEHPFTLSDAEARRDPALIETNPAGDRLAVSQRFADGLAHQYRNEGAAVRFLFTRPLDVWRALVLNLRIPWLVNNIVGNNLLYALRFAGNGGLRAYVDMLRDVRPRAVSRLVNSPASRTLSPADIAEIFPEQTRGTFIGTQLPSGKLGKFTKPIRVLNAGLAPLDRRTEQFLRRGGVNAVLRNSPEATAIYKSMPAQTRNWRQAMIQAAKGNADLRDLTVREVNDALGDYLSLGPFERGVLRRVAPFYGWYREITRIAAHNIVDRPLRVLIITRLGQLEQDKQQELRGAFPSFLQGSLALGAGPQGTENLLALRSANPFSTTVDLGRAASFFANPTNRSNAEALLGLTNPYLEAAAATAFGSARSDVASPAYLGPAATALNRFGLPGSILAQVAGGLPQVQAAFPPPPSRLYPTRTRQDIIERLLGDIRRQPSLQQAHYYASQGR